MLTLGIGVVAERRLDPEPPIDVAPDYRSIIIETT